VLSSSRAPVVSTVFNSNTGSKSTASFRSAVGEEITLRTPTREGFQFRGWFTKKKGGKLVGLAGEQFVPRKNSTLWDRWVPAPAPTSGGGGSGPEIQSIFDIANYSYNPNSLDWSFTGISYPYSFYFDGEELDHYYPDYTMGSAYSFGTFYSPESICGNFTYDTELRWESSPDDISLDGESWYTQLNAKTILTGTGIAEVPADYQLNSSPSILLYDNAGDNPTYLYYELPKSSVPKVTGVTISDSSLDYCWYAETFTTLNNSSGPVKFMNQYFLTLWANTHESPTSLNGLVEDLTFKVSTSTGKFTIGLLR
jgi:hypothetical protein